MNDYKKKKTNADNAYKNYNLKNQFLLLQNLHSNNASQLL